MAVRQKRVSRRPERPRASDVMVWTCRGKTVPVRLSLGPVDMFPTIRQEVTTAACSVAAPMLRGGSRLGAPPHLSPPIRIGVQAQICSLVTGILQPFPRCSYWAVSPVSPVGKGQFRACLTQTPFP